MAKVSKRIEHDWLALNATFADGQKANLSWSRGGINVKLEPHDSARAEAFSLMVTEAYSKASDPSRKLRNPGQILEAMEVAAESASNLDGYLAALKTALDVTGEKPKAKNSANAPAETQAQVSKSRGWLVKVFFSSGEKAELKINASSVGLSLDPNIPSRFREITGFVFGMKQAGLMGDQEIAESVADAARDSTDIGTWVDAMKASVALAGPRR